MHLNHLQFSSAFRLTMGMILNVSNAIIVRHNLDDFVIGNGGSGNINKSVITNYTNNQIFIHLLLLPSDRSMF